MLLHDHATIADGTARITRDGYLVADALVARADNIQVYHAAELGLADREPTAPVRIFRPATEVFAADSLASLAHRPITLDHPPAGVDAKSWKRLAVGDVGGEVMRDGEFVRVPIKVMDASAVESIRTNRREFSLGYAANLDMTPGVHDGQPYDGRMTGLRYNHLAAVSAARGGAELRIIDERTFYPKEPAMKIKIGDAEVDATNGEAVRIAVDALNTKLADSQTQLGKLTADLATANTAVQTKDGEIAALKQQLADATDPVKQAARDKARAAVVDGAKALLPSIVTDGKIEADIRKEVVLAKLGDAAKDMTDAAIEGAFLALTKDANPVTDKVVPIVPAAGFADAKTVRDLARAAQF